MPACAFTISPNAQKPTPSPYGRQRPCRNRIRSGSSSMNAENSRINRVLPTPGSPTTVTSCGEPARASCSAVLLHLAEHLAERGRLVGATDERGPLLLARVDADDAARAERPPDRERLRLAFHGDRRELLVLEHAGGGVVRRLADDDRPGGGDVLQSRRRVHHVARDALADLRPLPERDHGLAGVDPDPDGQLQARLLAVGLFDVIQDLQAGADRALGVVLVPHGRAEHAEHRVADELVHHAAEMLDRAFQQRVIDAEHRLDVLGVRLVGAFREPDEVAEQDRDDLALLAGGHALRAAIRSSGRSGRLRGSSCRTGGRRSRRRV